MKTAPRLLVAALISGQLICPRIAGASPQDPSDAPSAAAQTPTFRVGTDLLTVDVTVIDRNGRPVENLTPADFTVKVDGKARRVVAARFVKAGAETTVTPAPSANSEQSAVVPPTAAGAAPDVPGRHILIAVDQLYITPASIKPLLNAASRFIDQLTPRDEVGYIAFPAPGPRVDFTTDKARVKKALQELVGLRPIQSSATFDISLVEARTVTDRERHQVRRDSPESGGDEDTRNDNSPVMRDLMARNCPTDAGPAARNECRQRIVNESGEIAQRSRTDAKISVRTLESIVEQLGAVEGSKSLVLVSASMAIDDRRDLDQLIRIAEASRTSFNMLIVDPWQDDQKVAGNIHDQAPTENEDRRLRAEGLEELAADGRGAVYRVAGTAEGTFDRIALELSASYVLGLESITEDVKRDRTKVEVSVKRQGARVRTSQAYMPSARSLARRGADARPLSMETMLRDLLSEPSEIRELPLRVSTFNQWDPDGGKVRINLAAAFTQPGMAAGDYVIGYELTDSQKRTVASSAQKRASGDADDPELFRAVASLPPGAYTLHLSVVNADRKRATVIQRVTATRSTTDGPATSDLLVGDPPPAGKTLAPVADSRVLTTRAGAYFELYGDGPNEFDWTFVQLEVAKDADSPALASDDADLGPAALPAWRIVSGTVDVGALPAGSYVLRAKIVRDDKTIRTLTRPFELAGQGAPSKPN